MKIGEKCVNCGSINTIEEGNYITCKDCNLFRRKEKKRGEEGDKEEYDKMQKMR